MSKSVWNVRTSSVTDANGSIYLQLIPGIGNCIAPEFLVRAGIDVEKNLVSGDETIIKTEIYGWYGRTWMDPKDCLRILSKKSHGCEAAVRINHEFYKTLALIGQAEIDFTGESATLAVSARNYFVCSADKGCLCKRRLRG